MLSETGRRTPEHRPLLQIRLVHNDGSPIAQENSCVSDQTLLVGATRTLTFWQEQRNGGISCQYAETKLYSVAPNPFGILDATS
jgi:hypothetical protein